ncbi:MurR/RpiR family transcriptional regulator [Halomonas sp. B23F22_10]|uniref:MurR/RpiR family transcriptional regulator n=1 Tax=Halomonas sp. B23F22_10 TaxID=3459515 RepID=UPI00373F4145
MTDTSPSRPDARLETLADLERLLVELEAGDAALRLGRRSRQVLSALVGMPQQAAMSSISDLASRLGVNPSTLSRLAQRLGFEGFAGLQAVFRRHVTEGRHFYSDQVSRLLEGEQDDDALGRLARLGRQESANLGELVAGVNGEAFGRAARRLVDARRVRIHGRRQFASLASFMAYGLGMLRPDAATLDAAGHGIADALAQLDDNDVLVVMSAFPYTPSVLTAARVAARQGVPVIALTDAAGSPLARAADERFTVPNHSLFFSNGMCAFMLLAEGLLSEAASLLGEAGLASLERRERMIDELGDAL